MRIVDCFVELMAFVAVTSRDMQQAQYGYDQVRQNVLRLVSRSESLLNAGNFAPEDAESAKFAVFAWIDETLLSFPWQGRQQWQKEQLQRLYFGTTKAGEQFFDRLNGLGVQQRDVREVYYLCLALGFSGRYLHEDDRFLLNQLRNSNLKLLFGSSVGLPSLQNMELFPHAAPEEGSAASSGQRHSGFNAFTLIGLLAPVGIFGVLYLIFALVLSGYTKNILNMVS
jgi:type VI secretion system protein ImpK